MGCKPGFDIAAAFRRQFVVDVSVQLVLGDGNFGVGHDLCLFLIEIILVAFRSPRRKYGLGCNAVSPKNSTTTRSLIKFIIT
jgi:hypothetical protein